jgi:TolB-like protein/Tfp pilus assembly protein PilF
VSFFTELKRRNVFRMGIAYVVVAWVILQAIDFTLDIISAPNWVMQVFVVASIAGLPVVLIIAWIFELTPEGIKRESDVDHSQSTTQSTGRKMDRTIIVFLALAVVLLLADRFIMREDAPVSTSTVEPAKQQAVVKDEDTFSDKRSVAVLPFVNMSSDPEQDYFSDGLSEELLNRLAKNDQLQVAARTSSFQFKGQNQDISTIGRQLKVDNVLEGSVRKSGSRLRITAQLIRVDNGYHLWSETYEREMDDVFAIQDDISQAITRALEAELGASTTQSTQKPTENLEAYQLYLQARFLLAKRGGDNLLKSVELFRQATNLDSDFSKAWSGMAYAYGLIPSYTFKMSAMDAGRLALESATNAIRIDPDNPEAYMVLGRYHARTDIDIKLARENFEKAYELAPNNVDIVNLYGDFLVLSGNFSEALKMESRATELDPLAAVHYSDLAFLYLTLNRNEEALDPARTARALAPDSIDRHDAYVVSLIMLGQYEQAIEAIQMGKNTPDADPGFVTSWWAMLYYHQNDRENLRKILNQRKEMSKNSHNMLFPTVTAFYIAWLDGVEAAIPFLAESYDKKEQLLVWPEYFYLPENVSDDPQWLEFWQQPGLAELIETRRGFGPYENIGYWKPRSDQ